MRATNSVPKTPLARNLLDKYDCAKAQGKFDLTIKLEADVEEMKKAMEPILREMKKKIDEALTTSQLWGKPLTRHKSAVEYGHRHDGTEQRPAAPGLEFHGRCRRPQFAVPSGGTDQAGGGLIPDALVTRSRVIDTS